MNGAVFVLIVMGNFAITGFEDIKDCTDARDVVLRQVRRPDNAAVAVCVPHPAGGRVIGKGSNR